MKKINTLTIIDHLLWVINPCLLLLALFSNKISIGPWLSWMGQWHPVILHFPIVIGLFISIYFLANFKPKLDEVYLQYVLSIQALFSSVVALLGIFISLGGNYDKTLLLIHQWGGVLIALLAWMLMLIPQKKFESNKILRIGYGGLYFIIILFFTHKGGQLTHGKEALSLPKTIKNETQITKPDSLLTVYEKAVHPILLDKCISCHGGDKTKGDLQLTTIELIKKGGKHGNKLLERIHMPLQEEKHMPPTDKKQLTQEELTLLTKWMQLGGDANKPLKQMSKEDSLYILASKYIAPKFDKVKEQPSLSEYNSNYVSVQYDYHGGEKINVSFFQANFYKTELLKKLEKIKDQIVSLNMQSIKLKKEDVEVILSFNNLEKLNLNYTGLSFQDILPIANLKKLKSISLAGMAFEQNGINAFLNKTSVQNIYLWTNGLRPKDLAALSSKYAKVNFMVGDNLEDSIMKLNKPIIQQDSTIITDQISVPLKHFLKGVTIKYTIDDTDPDSLNSPTYSKPILLQKNTTLKTRVYKKGWLASDIVQKSFYKSALNPDTVILITKPDPKYIGKGGNTIIDHELGELNFGNGKWLGYSKTDMQFEMKFNKATSLNEVIFNALINTSSYIFPIQTIQIEASSNGKEFHIIQNADFTSVTNAYTKEPNINQAQAFKVKVENGKPFTYYRFTLRNLKKLPIWHPGKGTPAWIFVDEVFFN